MTLSSYTGRCSVSMKPHLYEAVATATESGREGHTATDDGRLSVDLSIPEAIGGSGGSGSDPEQLLAAGYAACFTSATRLVAPRSKQDANGVSVTARVRLHRREDDAGFEPSTELEVGLPNLDREAAQKLIEAADQICPYSNATRASMDMSLRVVDPVGRR